MRIVVATLVLVLFGSSFADGIASAGLKCEKLPRMVFYSTEADVHDDGTWHRTKHEVEQQGHLDDTALARFSALADASRRATDAAEKRAKDVQVIACLDALIAKPTSTTATKACAVPKAKSPR